ncbi:hypothetical protein [Pelomonas sp. SE-A7]|uniref:hypothetical protein n=1 Tax=Pelomonas sp. SE-A7 TaxID=3054953 RepID=UPI00259C725C|nr:hypothetical protein [Pelomonas sp. SE-A7]MDM4765729.1 hypothetical protein [Pelomonas sp. SE-A7]
MQASQNDKPAPWWRERLMWLVVGGPAAVVIASFATLTLAMRHPDPVIEVASRPSADSEGDAAAMQPAVKARNHAATGGR